MRLAAASLIALASPAFAHERPQPLHSGPAAGSEHWREVRVEVRQGERLQIYNTSQPVYTLYLPRPERASGAAVVMLPGGGLRVLSAGAALHDEIDALVAQGVAVMLLEYRTIQLTPAQIEQAIAPRPPRPVGSPPERFPRLAIVNGNANPAPGDAALSEVLRLATKDAQAALRLLHQNAAAWQIDPARIGLMGTSAGGGVAFSALMDRAAPEEERPDFLISIFGPALQDIATWEGAPPLFMAVEAEHGAVTDGLIEAFRIWNAQYQPAELHIYAVPNFTMTVDLWGPRLFAWMREQNLIAD